ncbi:MAG: hypothetical protein WC552_04630 [Candidatus Omnitrophota bacterium]
MMNTPTDQNPDEHPYEQLQKRQLREWEALCRHCGACCGATEGDPCEHLLHLESGQCACDIYEHRFGLHKTRSGKTFYCLPIREILNQDWPGSGNCAYKKRPGGLSGLK